MKPRHPFNLSRSISCYRRSDVFHPSLSVASLLHRARILRRRRRERSSPRARSSPFPTSPRARLLPSPHRARARRGPGADCSRSFPQSRARVRRGPAAGRSRIPASLLLQPSPPGASSPIHPPPVLLLPPNLCFIRAFTSTRLCVLLWDSLPGDSLAASPPSVYLLGRVMDATGDLCSCFLSSVPACIVQN